MDDQDFEFNIDQDFQLGQSYAENNIEASSKQLYDWKIKHFEVWIKRKQPHMVLNDNIQYHLISNEVLSLGTYRKKGI